MILIRELVGNEVDELNWIQFLFSLSLHFNMSPGAAYKCKFFYRLNFLKFFYYRSTTANSRVQLLKILEYGVRTVFFIFFYFFIFSLIFFLFFILFISLNIYSRANRVSWGGFAKSTQLQELILSMTQGIPNFA